MSTNTQPATDGDGFIEEQRERLFFASLIIGMAVFALGFAFGVLFIAMNTTPPAPYFTSTTEKYLTGAMALGFLLGGAGIMRIGTKIGGW
jgi:hypothetical protein